MRLVRLLALILHLCPLTVSAANFRPELVKPGTTDAASLAKLLGKPVRVVKDTPNHEYYFFDLDSSSAMDATVSVRKGIVEYITYLCDDSMRDVKGKFGDHPSVTRSVDTGGRGYAAHLTQVLYDSAGKGFLYEPRSLKVKACVAWEPGHKFDELGR